MGILQNFDLLFVGIVVASMGIMTTVVFLNGRKTRPEKTFMFFTLAAIFLSVVNLIAYRIDPIASPDLTIWFLRIDLFLAVWFVFAFLTLCYFFPAVNSKYPIWHKFILLPATILVSLFSLSPLVFKEINSISSDGKVLGIALGPLITLFGVYVFFTMVGGLIILVKKLKNTNKVEKEQIKYLIIGLFITAVLLLFFNFTLPVIFENPNFVEYLAFYLFPIVVFVFYAIWRHKLFNIKVGLTAFLVVLLAVVTFAEVVLAGRDNLSLLAFRSLVFLLVLTFGILLIRSVKKEVDQREKIEGLMRELGHANDRLWVANEKLQELDKLKTEFVSMATHQLRSPLTAIKGYASMILENSFGPVETKARGAVEVIFESSEKLVKIIEDFLNISRIELGTMKYEKQEFDFREMIGRVVEELRSGIEKKGLRFIFSPAPDTDYKFIGDPGKLAQVVGNLIDNAFKYTPSGPPVGEAGWINVALERRNGKIRLTVADSGVGIKPEVMPRLFQKFSRAADAGKVNIQGTGLGLYVAKQIVEAHNGKIWAESEGAGKGSRFVVEI